MSPGWLVALGLVVLYVLFLVWLVQTDRLRRWDLSLMLGFALMVRTHRGKGLIERLSRPKRLWNAFGDLAIALCLAGMALMVLVLALTLVVSLTPDSGVEPLTAQEILVIPGVNPFVPLWYGLAALVVTLVVHEGGHGILARANGMRLKSLGLLVAVIPIGAFVEPDEDDVKAAPRRRRLRVFAAGPAVNLAFAALFLAGFTWMTASVVAVPGLHVAGTSEGTPAHEAGIRAGDAIASLDGQALAGWEDFQGRMEARSPGDTVALGLGDGTEARATLDDYWSGALDDDGREAVLREDAEAMALCRERLEPDPASGAECAERLQERAFLGVVPLLPSQVGWLGNPFADGGVAFLQVVSLPVGEVKGQPFFSLYLPAFFATPFDADVFWPLATLLFWMFWINLMVGLTNILPIGILDGGHIFRDAVGGLVGRLRPAMDPQRRDRVVAGTARAVSFLVFGAFLLQVIGPWLVR